MKNKKFNKQFEQKQTGAYRYLFRRSYRHAIQEVAKENGYTYVLPREALLVMPPADDIGYLG